jgi:nitrous oxidase accessory protein
VIGMDRPIPRRGDGIRLWYCEGGMVEGNELRRTRDLVIWFSNGLDIRNNRITHGRYGLHYMYSDNNALVGNTFVSNDVGAFVMYSKNIRLEENRFERAAGASALGIGLKDSDGIVAERNVFVGNAVGIFLDNSPSTVDGRNRFTHNVLAANGAGVELLPSVHSNRFEGNAWIGNDVPVVVTGGGDALDNEWSANHWSRYVGFDEDGDGTGDTPYRHDRLADDLFARYPDLRFLAGSPAVASLEVLARLFPLLAPRPVVIDSSPLVAPPAIAAAALPAPEDRQENRAGDPPSDADGDLRFAALLWTASLGSALSVVLLTRRTRS